VLAAPSTRTRSDQSLPRRYDLSDGDELVEIPATQPDLLEDDNLGSDFALEQLLQLSQHSRPRGSQSPSMLDDD